MDRIDTTFRPSKAFPRVDRRRTVVGLSAPDVTLTRRSAAELADLVGPAVRDYVASVCGPHAPPRVAEEALEAIATGNGHRPGDRPAADLVRDAARTAALGEAAQTARHWATRLRQVGRGRFGYEKVPELLRQRAAGMISERDLRWLYRRLERCPDCGGLAMSLAAAEWQLRLDLNDLSAELDEIGPPPTAPAGRRSHSLAPAPRGQVLTLARPSQSVAGTRLSRSVPGSRRLRAAVAAGVALIAVACVAVAVDLLAGSPPQRPSAPVTGRLLIPMQPIFGPRPLPARTSASPPSASILG